MDADRLHYSSTARSDELPGVRLSSWQASGTGHLDSIKRRIKMASGAAKIEPHPARQTEIAAVGKPDSSRFKKCRWIGYPKTCLLYTSRCV